jgi:hypothetical protein
MTCKLHQSSPEDFQVILPLSKNSLQEDCNEAGDKSQNLSKATPCPLYSLTVKLSAPSARRHIRLIKIAEFMTLTLESFIAEPRLKPGGSENLLSMIPMKDFNSPASTLSARDCTIGHSAFTVTLT